MLCPMQCPMWTTENDNIKPSLQAHSPLQSMAHILYLSGNLIIQELSLTVLILYILQKCPGSAGCYKLLLRQYVE